MKKLPCPICGALMDAEDAQIMGGCRECLRGEENNVGKLCFGEAVSGGVECRPAIQSNGFVTGLAGKTGVGTTS
jgi:hypothetical protein